VIPWIKTGELSDGYVAEYEERINQEAIQNSAAKILPRGTILMAMYGATVGALGMLTEPAACNQASCAMVANPEVCDGRWLFYALRNDREKIVSLATGAAQQNLNVGTIRNFRYLTPPLLEQRAIAEVLGALDDKIAANTKLVNTLDQYFISQWLALIAQSVAPSGTLSEYLAEAIAGDWGSESVSDLASEDVYCVRGADIFSLQSSQLGKTPSRFIQTRSLLRRNTRHGDIVVEMSGGSPTQSTGRSALITHQLLLHAVKPIVSSNFCKVIRAIDSSNSYAIYAMLRCDWSNDLFFQYENGSTGIKNLAFKEYATRRPVPSISPEQLASFNIVSTDLFQAAQSAANESGTLTELRDTLLPQLMSGKLRVKDAETAVEEVL
jgi:type I restriction enzyme S subunit